MRPPARYEEAKNTCEKERPTVNVSERPKQKASRTERAGSANVHLQQQSLLVQGSRSSSRGSLPGFAEASLAHGMPGSTSLGAAMGVRANVGNAGSMGKTKTSSQTQASQPEWRAAWSAQTATYPVFPCWVKKIVITSLPKGKSFLPRSYSWIYIYICDLLHSRSGNEPRRVPFLECCIAKNTIAQNTGVETPSATIYIYKRI